MTAHPPSEHVEALVVGSGFGGSVAAFRLAEAGRSVVLLERGRAFPPGSFPRSARHLSRTFWAPDEKLYGLFDVWKFKGLDSVVSSGLGGGSLIYANVLLRKDEKWFVHEEPLPGGGGYETWPVSRADLDPHYDRVEKMIGMAPYPLEHADYADTPKAHAMQDAAAELGLDWRLPPLAVSFAPGTGAGPGLGLPIDEPFYGNIHRMGRVTCRLCGGCDLGCNDGSKNSLDHTYLSAAAYYGADIRTLHEVTTIRPRQGGGYEVGYLVHDPDGGSPHGGTISCDRLVLGAGTYGTVYLLLRNQEHLPGLSTALGSRFSGNGDLLTFALDAKDRARVRPLDASKGPVITSAIRLPDTADGVSCGGSGRGAYIEDGGYPSFVDYLVDCVDVPAEMRRVARFVWERFRDFITAETESNLTRELHELAGHGALSVSSLPLLGMGRDVPDGVLRISDDRLQVFWDEATSDPYFERVRETMKRIAHVLGAEYADNPMWFRKRVISVHPLGGAPMADHSGIGVCNPFGEVFGHPGLYIADGAAMPGPVGANPSLTIAAWSDRLSTHLLETWHTPTHPTSVPAPTPSPDLDESATTPPDERETLGAGARGRTTAGTWSPTGSDTDANRLPNTDEGTTSDATEDLQPQARSVADAGGETNAGAEADAGGEAGAKAGAGADADAGVGVGAGVGGEARTEADRGTRSEAGARVAAAADAWAGTDAEARAGLGEGNEGSFGMVLIAGKGTGMGTGGSGVGAGAVASGEGVFAAPLGSGAADTSLDSASGASLISSLEADVDARTSLSFTEEMKGHYTAGVSNPRAGELASGRERFEFRLTITAADVDRFLAEAGHTATAEGWIDATGLGGRREVSQGWFNLFAPDGSPDRRLMKYRLYFTDGDDQPRTLAGWKNVFHGPPTDIWPDTSTLFFRVMEGHVTEAEDERARIIGAGTLHILLTDFAHQLTTFRTSGPHGLRAMARFGRFFAGELWDVYRPEHEHSS